MTLKTALALVRKDLRLFVRDRTALFFAIVLPIGLASVMGTALGGSGGGGPRKIKKVTIAVEDRDGSEESRAFVETLRGSGDLRVEVVEDARRLVANGDRAGGLVIPEGYGRGLGAGDVPRVTLYRDPAQQIASQVMVFQLAPVLMQGMAGSMGAGMMGRMLDMLSFPSAGRAEAEAALRTSFDRVGAIVDQLEASGIEWTGASEEGDAPGGDGEGDDDGDGSGFDLMGSLPGFLGLDVEDLEPERDGGIPVSAGASHAFAAMAVMMLLFNLVAAAGTLQDERAEGTLDRLRLTPAAGRAVLLGKMLVTMLLAGCQLAVLFGFGAIVFGVPVGPNAFELAVASFVWAFAASALGLLFATACATRKQMEGLSTLVILGMSAVGGAWFPREVAPDWFQTVGLVTPVAWAMDAYHGILWYDKGLLATPEKDGVIVPILVLAGAGAAMFALSLRLYRRRFDSA
ncbi:MAG: ABC transporter permease [Planctomycetota bacterium]